MILRNTVSLLWQTPVFQMKRAFNWRIWGTKISDLSKLFWLVAENLVCSLLKPEQPKTISPRTTVLFFPLCHFLYLLPIYIHRFISPSLPLFLLSFPTTSMFLHHIILAKLLPWLNPTSCPIPQTLNIEKDVLEPHFHYLTKNFKRVFNCPWQSYYISQWVCSKDYYFIILSPQTVITISLLFSLDHFI